MTNTLRMLTGEKIKTVCSDHVCVIVACWWVYLNLTLEDFNHLNSTILFFCMIYFWSLLCQPDSKKDKSCPSGSFLWWAIEQRLEIETVFWYNRWWWVVHGSLRNTRLVMHARFILPTYMENKIFLSIISSFGASHRWFFFLSLMWIWCKIPYIYNMYFNRILSSSLSLSFSLLRWSMKR